MDSARADILAAREQLQRSGWIARRSEAFHHLSPPALPTWLPTWLPAEPGAPQDAAACTAPPLAGAGWTLHPLGAHAASGIEARWLDAHDPAQRAELFQGVDRGEGAAAPFAWAHRALCRQGLRLRIAGAPGRSGEPVWLALHHQPRHAAEAPLLVLDVAPGVHCVLIETHEREVDSSAVDGPDGQAGACTIAVAQNLHAHIHLAAGAQLQHLRVCAPAAGDSVAHHLHATLGAGARYAQALVATTSAYHLQRSRIALQGAGAQAHSGALLLAAQGQVDQQVYTDMQGPRSRSTVQTLALAQGRAHAVANAHTRIAPGCDDARVHQRLTGVPLAGRPRLILRPHLEILHDNVQAAHGATWGALPEDALFYARQRGLDPAAARALVIEGMARALLERCLGPEPTDGAGMLAQWLQGGWLSRAIARQVRTTTEEVSHG